MIPLSKEITTHKQATDFTSQVEEIKVDTN